MTKTAKVFMSGQGQTVRLPKECWFEDSEVLVKKIGDMVVLIPKNAAGQIIVDQVETLREICLSEQQFSEGKGVRSSEAKKRVLERTKC